MMRVSSSSREASPTGQCDEEPITFSEEELIESFFLNERFSSRPKRGGIQTLRTKLVPFYIISTSLMFVLIIGCSAVATPKTILDNSDAKIGLVMMFVCLSLYFILLNSDPGWVRSKREHARGDPGVSGVVVDDAVPSPKIVKTTCRVCVTRQPMRTKHCNTCNRCIYTFDHHCWWINNCVGGKNKPTFMLFLLAQAALCFQSAHFCLLSITISLNYYSVVNVVLMVSCLLAGFSVTKLLFFHLKMVLCNKTSLEFLRPDQCLYLHSSTTLPSCCQQRHNFFSKGVLANLRDFLFTKPIEWSVVNPIPATTKGCSKKCTRLEEIP
eukprot:TRINITY_DN2873_c0_g2_i1.p1 TRINITY_DN2873_c0_g2~~TRINITY_DN2873_c0_g2_i1.p1  ORF type:complete len:340 (+),score=46.68 TRINITY_DN2873_c0_g2_i1:46-1020(+)